MPSGLFAALLTLALSAFPAPIRKLQDPYKSNLEPGIKLSSNVLTIRPGAGSPTVVNDIVFAKRHAWIAAAKDFGRVLIWDMGTGHLMAELDGKQGIVQSLAFSSDDKLLATAGQGSEFTITVWDTSSHRIVKRIEGFNTPLRRVQFTSGDALLLWNNDGISVVDLSSGRTLFSLKDEYHPVLNADGSVMVTMSHDFISFWNTRDWTKLRSLPRAKTNPTPLALSSDRNKMIVLLPMSREVAVWDSTSGQQLEVTPAHAVEFNLAAGGFASFSSNQRFVIGHSNATAWAWDTKENRICTSEILYNEAGVLSPDGTLIASGKDNSILQRAGGENGVWLWSTDDVLRACFNQIGEFAAR